MDNQKSITPPDMRDQLGRFALWFRLVRATVLLQWLFFAALCFVSLWVFADRMLYLGGYYGIVAQGLVCACLLTLLVTWLVYRVQPARVSYDVDQAIGSKNLVASALQATDNNDEVSRRVVTRATSTLAQRKPSDVMPMKLTWPGRYAAVPCIALVAALFIPQQDLLERKLRRDLAESEKVRVEESTITLKATLASVQKHASSVEGPDGDVTAAGFCVDDGHPHYSYLWRGSVYAVSIGCRGIACAGLGAPDAYRLVFGAFPPCWYVLAWGCF